MSNIQKAYIKVTMSKSWGRGNDTVISVNTWVPLALRISLISITICWLSNSRWLKTVTAGWLSWPSPLNNWSFYGRTGTTSTGGTTDKVPGPQDNNLPRPDRLSRRSRNAISLSWGVRQHRGQTKKSRYWLHKLILLLFLRGGGNPATPRTNVVQSAPNRTHKLWGHSLR